MGLQPGARSLRISAPQPQDLPPLMTKGLARMTKGQVGMNKGDSGSSVAEPFDEVVHEAVDEAVATLPEGDSPHTFQSPHLTFWCFACV